MSAQAELAAAEVTGQAGNGLVTSRRPPRERPRRHGSTQVVDPDDVETLQDLVVGAIARRRAGRPSCRPRRWARWRAASAATWAARPARLLACSRSGPGLIDELGRLPGVGPKSAQRIAFHLLSADPADVDAPAGGAPEGQDGVQFCEVCGNVAAARAAASAATPGATRRWSASSRSRRTSGGRAHPRVPRSLSRAGRGARPAGRRRPRSLRIRELLARLGGRTGRRAEIGEVIIATDPNTEGEATATYLVRLLRDFPGLTVTRLGVRPADGRRPRVRRRAHARAGPLRSPSAVVARRPGARGAGRWPGVEGCGAPAELLDTRSDARVRVPDRCRGGSALPLLPGLSPVARDLPSPSGLRGVVQADGQREDARAARPRTTIVIMASLPVRRRQCRWMLLSSSGFPSPWCPSPAVCREVAVPAVAGWGDGP